jgi:Ser/Thr protein kinase RdoA (MazF antagonist)
MTGPVFPSNYSTLCPSALALMIQERYGFRPVYCSLLLKGVGDTYLVETAASNYILRVYRSSHRSLGQIGAELELLLALQPAVEVSYPLRDNGGELVQTLHAIEGPRYAVLFTFAPGDAVAVPDDRQLDLLGAAVARFHNVSAGFADDGRRWTYDLETTLHRPLDRMEPYMRALPDAYAWLKDIAGVIEDRLQKLDTGHFSRGYCHFDLLPKNFHFKDDRVTLFDFDFMGHGWLVNDVMTFWQHLQVEAYTGRTTQARADEAFQRFLAAYRVYRTLTGDELKAVPLLMPGFWVFYMGFHTTHDHFLPYLQPASLKPRVKALQQIMSAYV